VREATADIEEMVCMEIDSALTHGIFLYSFSVPGVHNLRETLVESVVENLALLPRVKKQETHNFR
jgi:hypothetical protein